MQVERTPIATGDPVTLAELQEHMRLDADLVIGAQAYAQTAALEIEAYTNIALMRQAITCTTNTWPGQHVALPIGPVAADATVTVHLIELDGTTTLVPDGYWLEGGRYPVLHFTDGEPGGRLRITYPAGYGSTYHDIPADLRMAICDLAARLYDHRASDKAPAMPAATARICARYRRVRA